MIKISNLPTPPAHEQIIRQHGGKYCYISTTFAFATSNP